MKNMEVRESFTVTIILEGDSEDKNFCVPSLTQLLDLFDSGKFELEYYSAPHSYPEDRPILLMRKK